MLFTVEIEHLTANLKKKRTGKKQTRQRADKEKKSIFIVRQRQLAVWNSHLPNPLPILNIYLIFFEGRI